VDESGDHWSSDEFRFGIIGWHPYKDVLILDLYGRTVALPYQHVKNAILMRQKPYRDLATRLWYVLCTPLSTMLC
jgi:hypothetical protein